MAQRFSGDTRSCLAKNMRVVEFYLEEVVFPKETRQFPFKIAGSAWDLSAGRMRGFSGTADNRQLLPLGVKQHETELLQASMPHLSWD